MNEEILYSILLYCYKEIFNGVTDLWARRMSHNLEAIENRCSEAGSNMYA